MSVYCEVQDPAVECGEPVLILGQTALNLGHPVLRWDGPIRSTSVSARNVVAVSANGPCKEAGLGLAHNLGKSTSAVQLYIG